MAVYFVVDVEQITDPQTYDVYREQVVATIQQYAGRFVVRGGAYQTVEGEWQPQRFVILQFEKLEDFQRWYHSAEYSRILPLRLQASTARAIVVEGV